MSGIISENNAGQSQELQGLLVTLKLLVSLNVEGAAKIQGILDNSKALDNPFIMSSIRSTIQALKRKHINEV